MPAVVRGQLVGFNWAPGTSVIGEDGGVVGVDDLAHDAPLLFDGVLAGESGSVAVERVIEEAFVGFLASPKCFGEVDVEVDIAAGHASTGFFGLHLDGDAVIVPEPKPYDVRMGLVMAIGEE